MDNQHTNIITVKKVLVLFGLVLLAFALWSLMPKTTVPVTTEQVPESQVLPGTTYINEEYGISFRYSDLFTVNTANEGTYLSWGSEAIAAKSLVSIRLPKSFQPQTNFSEGVITVYIAPVSADTCLTPQVGEMAAGTQGEWSVFTTGDAGAGNYYESTNYRTVKNGSCIMIESLIHSTSLGAYDPSQGIVAFDKDAVNAKLAEVIATVEL